MVEDWRPVRGYEGLYEVSASGKVRSIKRGIVLRPCFDGRKQYVHVNLWKDGLQKSTNVHRIVAMAFIPNPNGLPEINHIDEDKTNNAASNLEWCDHTYNSRYGSKLTASRGEKNAMNKYDAVDRANNPKLTEVPVGKYATGDQLARFDLAFEAKLKDPKKILVVLFSSVPNYDPIQAAWSGDLCIFTKENNQ